MHPAVDCLDARRSPPIPHVRVLLIGLLAGLSACTVADPDLWGHVRFGQDILTAGHVIRSDPYSFTSDQAWTNHEWLAEIIMAGAYRFGGVRGLVALSSGVAALVLLLAGRLLRRTGVGEPATIALLAIVVRRYWSAVDSRDSTADVLGTLLPLMLMLLNGVGRGREMRLLWLAPLFALWANLHGGWIVGLGILGLWAGVETVTRQVSWKWGTLASSSASSVRRSTRTGGGCGCFSGRRWDWAARTSTEWQSLFAQPAGIHSVGRSGPSSSVSAGVGESASVSLRVHPVGRAGLLAIKVVRLDCFFVLAAVIMLGPLWAGLGPVRLPLSRRPASRVNSSVVALMASRGSGDSSASGP